MTKEKRLFSFYQINDKYKSSKKRQGYLKQKPCRKADD